MLRIIFLVGGAALLSVLLPVAEACSCILPFPTLCDVLQEETSLVLRGTISSFNNDDLDSVGNGNVVYEVETTALYNPDPTVRYAQTLSFLTGGNSAQCGVEFEVGSDVLLFLTWEEFSGSYVTGSCSNNTLWSLVSEEDVLILESGRACDASGCDIACGEFQECLFYEETASTGEYYCADVCDSSRCLSGEMCDLMAVTCVRAPCPPVAVCSPASEMYAPFGCYVDSPSNRLLTGKSLLDDPNLTAKDCAVFCDGSDYFGTEYGQECFCSRAVDDPAGQGESVSCDLADLPCTGDVEEMCGGTLVISLYEVAQPVVITGPSYGGCYTDDINNRVLSGIFVRDDLDMTPEVCATFCEGSPYFGIEYSDECFCGVEGDDFAELGESSACNLRCSGDGRQTCGGPYAISVYKSAPTL